MKRELTDLERLEIYLLMERTSKEILKRTLEQINDLQRLCFNLVGDVSETKRGKI